MTLPDERYRALLNIRPALLAMCSPGRLTKAEVRRTVRWLLKHYPTIYDLERMAKKCPELLKP
jgi:hypothetical protein